MLGGGISAVSVPDIRTDMIGWFKYYDRSNKGLDKNQLINALTFTMKDHSMGSPDSIRSTISELWPIFDTDNSGRISLHEFTAPGGLGETILAQVVNGNKPQPGPVPMKPPKPVAQNNSVAEIHSIFPHFSEDHISKVLISCNGNKEEAVNKLLLSGSTSSTPSAPPAFNPFVNENPPVSHSNPSASHVNQPVSKQSSVANNLPMFNCGRCSTKFAVSTSAVPRGVTSFMASCPSCHAQNQIDAKFLHVPPSGIVVNPHLPPAPPGGSADPSNRPDWRPRAGLNEQPAPPQTLPPQGISGRQKALLIGINYKGQKGELRGCVNDVLNMYRLLTVTFHWSPQDIRVLVDDSVPFNLNPQNPTRSNIIAGLEWLAADVKPGDSLFFHYSGHGAQQEDKNGVEEDGMNETILPVDYKRSGMITDDQISSIIVQTLPQRARLTAVMDSCHSGTGLDLPYTWTISSRRFVEETNPYHSLGDVQLFSGCEDGKTSADAANFYSSPGGAMTTAFCDVIRMNPCPTYTELLTNIHIQLQRKGFKQKPQLSSSQSFEVNRPFLLSDAVPNSNKTLGRTMRKRFKPRRRAFNDPVMADMLGMGAMAMGGFLVADMLFG